MYVLSLEEKFSKQAALFLSLFILKLVTEVECSFDYDHFEYVQEWPPSMQLRNSSSPLQLQRRGASGWKNANIWTIHGLWPDGKERIENCSDSWHFDINQIKSIKGDMDKYWPSWKKSWTNEDFWKHEWKMHGTCAATKPQLDSQLKYFSKALQLRNQVAIDQALRSKNIIPDNKKTYMVKDVVGALADKFGKDNFFINCDLKKNTQIISDVRVCINTSYEFMRCPDLPRSGIHNTDVSHGERVAKKTWKSYQDNVMDYCTLLCKCNKTLVYPVG